MDKYQRKQLARWEAKKAKTQVKFESRVREYFDQDARNKIEAFAKSYTPHPTRVLHGMIKEGEKLIADLRRPPPHLGGLMISSRVSLVQLLFMDDYDFVWTRRSAYERFYEYNVTSLEMRIDVPKTMDAIRDHKDNAFRRDYLRGVLRSVRRLDMIRDELGVATRKIRAIQNCHVIKEELMMEVWHPRRVEKILDAYGWEVYDNLLGVE